jgi:hypothetical protein
VAISNNKPVPKILKANKIVKSISAILETKSSTLRRNETPRKKTIKTKTPSKRIKSGRFSLLP